MRKTDREGSPSGSSRKILEVLGIMACVPDLPERLKGRVLLCTGIQQPTVPPG